MIYAEARCSFQGTRGFATASPWRALGTGGAQPWLWALVSSPVGLSNAELFSVGEGGRGLVRRR